MQPFFIAPTEALLIGLCLEEYLFLKKHVENLPFLMSMRCRVSPFIPDMRSVTAGRIDTSEVPSDVEWLLVESSKKYGRSPTNPHCTYFLDSEGACKIRLDESRRSLVWLLAEYLGNALGMSKEYRAFLNAHHQSDADFAKIYFDFELAKAAVQGVYSDCVGREDDPEAIEQHLGELARFNEFGGLLELGRQFGRLLGCIRCYEYEMPAREFAPMLLSAVAVFCQSGRFPDNPILSSALKSLLEVFEKELSRYSIDWKLAEWALDEGFGFPGNEIEMRRTLERIELDSDTVSTNTPDDNTSHGSFVVQELRRQQFDRAWMLFWTAFGQILGSVRETDETSLREDAARASPRAIEFRATDSLDRIRDLIHDAERELNSPADMPSVPERNVGQLVKCIEPLMRKLWPRMSASWKTAELLHWKLQSPAVTEYRFASTAIGLWKSYRHDAVHKFDEFECSFEEARFVLAGIRMLYRIASSTTGIDDR